MIKLVLLADYHQIHLLDQGSAADFSNLWNDQAIDEHVAVALDAIAISTVVNVDIEVVVDLVEGPPMDDSANFDHVVEASICSLSGSLVLMGSTDYFPEAQRFSVIPGWLRIRVSQGNLDQAYQAGVNSDSNAQTMEKLRLQIWPSSLQCTVVVKRWTPPVE